MSEISAASQVVITCVHGTWGRGFFARNGNSVAKKRKSTRSSLVHWFESGSSFQQSLSEELANEGVKAEFDCFEWSGDNSILQRDVASESLATLLRSQSKRFPEYEKVIIAHSHGGNVAMRALTRLGNLNEKISVVTLATPFVQVISGRPAAFTSLAIYFTLGFALFVLGTLGLIVGPITLFGWMVSLSGSEIEFPPLLLALISLASFIISGAAIYGLKRRDAVSTWLDGLSEDASEFSSSVRQLCKETALPIMSSQLRPLLVLRGIDDEAAFALTAGAIGARLSRLVISILDDLESIVLVGGVFIFLPMTIIVGTVSKILGVEWSGSTWLIYLLIGICAAFFVVLPILIVLSVILCGLFKSVFGRELLHGSVFLDVVSNSTPDFIGHVDTLTLPNKHNSSAKLHHYLYTHPLVCKAIATWLSCSGNDSQVRRSVVRIIDSYNKSTKG